jgi:hypothetical protein
MSSMHMARMVGTLLFLIGYLASSADSMGQPAAKGDFRADTVLFGKSEVVNFVFNVKTGAAWVVTEKTKKPIEDVKAPGDGSYEFRSEASEDDFWTFRLDRDTGRTWALREGKWLAVKDAGTLARGNYEIFMRTTAKDVWIRRLDRATGDLWYCRWDSKEKTWSWSALGK